MRYIKLSFMFIAIIALSSCMSSMKMSDSHSDIQGKVELNGEALEGLSVDLYQVSQGNISPQLIETYISDKKGEFTFHIDEPENFYFLKTSLAENKKIEFLTVYDGAETVVLNEKTTIASTAVYAQFISQGLIQGDLKILKFGEHSSANMVDPATGFYGKTLLNGENLTESTTMGKLNTLGNLFIASSTDPMIFDQWTAKALMPAEQDESVGMVQFLSDLFQHSWYNTKEQFSLFTKLYPREKELRNAPLVPYLEMAPDEFALMIRFSGGGIYSPGKIIVDRENNIWSGQNWMPGAQANTLRSIGGGMSKLSPSGKPLSPPITGFIGGGVDGCGWGTAYGDNKVWMSSFNGKIAIFDMDGNALDYKIDGSVENLMGVSVSPVNGDVWVCDGKANQMVLFPEGDLMKGRVVKVPNLASPFSVVIDKENNVWVGNSAGFFVTMFNASDPTTSQKYMSAGISNRGLVLDNNDQVWIANTFNMDTKVPKVDPSYSIMEQFTFLGRFVADKWPPYTTKTEGTVALLDKKNPMKPQFIIGGDGSKITGPWGLNVDGANNLWIASFLSAGIGQYATEDMAEWGLKKGDLIHRYESGLYQETTDMVVDYMGNVWVANNWNNLAAVLGLDNSNHSSTKGGGAGITVIYGVATPVEY